MAKGVSDFTNIRTLPRWQKITVVSIIAILAASFMIAPVMMPVFTAYMSPNQLIGSIGSESINADQFETRRFLFNRLTRHADKVFPKVALVDPLLDAASPDPFSHWSLYIGRERLSLPVVVERRMRRDQPMARLDSEESEFSGRLVWQHLLLLRLAQEAGITVRPEVASEVAREIVTGPRPTHESMPIGADEKDATPVAREKRLSGLLEARERDYVSKLRSAWSRTPAAEFERIIQEMLVVKAYVEREFAINATVSTETALEGFRSHQQLARVQYLRVPADNPRREAMADYAGEMPHLAGELGKRVHQENGRVIVRGLLYEADRDALLAASADAAWQAAATKLVRLLRPIHPEVERRAQQLLERDRALAAARRALATGTAASEGTLYPDPLDQFALDRVGQRSGTASDNYHETRFQIAILAAPYETLARYVPVKHEQIVTYYTTYRDDLYRKGTLTDTEIDAKVKEMRTALEAEHKTESSGVGSGDGGTQTAPQTGPNGGDATGGWAPEGGWDAWTIATRDALKYTPMSEVEDEIRARIRELGAHPLAIRLFHQLREHIDSRIQTTRTVREHSRRMLQNRSDEAMLLDRFYKGDPDRADLPGVIPAADDLVSKLAALVRQCLINAGLSDDPSGEGSTIAPVTGMADVATWRAAFDTFAQQVMSTDNGALEDFLKAAQLGPDTLSASNNALAEVENRLINIDRSIATQQKTNEQIESVRALEELAVQREGLIARRDAIVRTRNAWLPLRDRLNDLLTNLRAQAWLVTSDKAPRILLEEFSLNAASSLQAAVKNTRVASGIDEAATKAREAWLEAQSALDEFVAESETVVNDMSREFPPSAALDWQSEAFPVALRALGVEAIPVRQVTSWPGKLYTGLPGAGLAGFTLERGMTMEELRNNSDLKHRLPFFSSATSWDLTNDRAGSEQLPDVLRGLTKGSWSKVLGAPDVGLYMVMLLDKREIPAPAPAEVRDEARKDKLATYREQAARELAESIRRRLFERIEELRGATAEQLASQLDRVSNDLGGRTTDAMWSADAIRALATAVRGNDPGDKNVNDLVGPASVRAARAAAEARALLIDHAFVAMADKYDLDLGTTPWFSASEDLADITLANGEGALHEECLTLAPRSELGSPLEEQFPNEPGNERTTGAAWLVFRSLGLKQGDRPESQLNVNLIDPLRLKAALTGATTRRAVGLPALQRLTDLGSLIQDFEAKGTPIRIYAFKADRREQHGP